MKLMLLILAAALCLSSCSAAVNKPIVSSEENTSAGESISSEENTESEENTSSAESGDLSEDFYLNALEKWKFLGCIRDFDGTGALTQQRVREAYPNYLYTGDLYPDNTYDYWVDVNDLDKFSKDFFGVSFSSLECDLLSGVYDEEKGVKFYQHPQIYPKPVTYSSFSYGEAADDIYYFSVQLSYNFEGLAESSDTYVVKNIYVEFKSAGEDIYFIKQASTEV